MHQIPHIEYYKLYDASVDEVINYFYSKDELVKFIAKWFKEIFWADDAKEVVNSFIKKCANHPNELFVFNKKYYYYKDYILYDNYNRIINPHDFEEEALTLYKKGAVKPIFEWDWINWKKRYSRSFNFLIKQNNYEYRKDPVPHTRKIRGGPHWSPPHTAGIIRMYKNPEYKDFNRGSWHKIPTWWDDRTRKVQRSWKEQSKSRHQWQKRRNNFKNFS